MRSAGSPVRTQSKKTLKCWILAVLALVPVCEALQLGQRQRGVPAVVVPFLCMLVPQIAHAGRFLRPVIRIAVAGSNTTGGQ